MTRAEGPPGRRRRGPRALPGEVPASSAGVARRVARPDPRLYRTVLQGACTSTCPPTSTRPASSDAARAAHPRRSHGAHRSGRRLPRTRLPHPGSRVTNTPELHARLLTGAIALGSPYRRSRADRPVVSVAPAPRQSRRRLPLRCTPRRDRALRGRDQAGPARLGPPGRGGGRGTRRPADHRGARRVESTSQRSSGVEAGERDPLRRKGVAVARCPVERPMGELGLEGVIRGQRRRTTLPSRRRPARRTWSTATSRLRGRISPWRNVGQVERAIFHLHRTTSNVRKWETRSRGAWR